MRRNAVGRILSVAVPLILLTAGPAHAGVTCRWVKAWCPPATQDPGTQASVPEPATLVLLATGFGAAGLSAWRRRKKKD